MFHSYTTPLKQEHKIWFELKEYEGLFDLPKNMKCDLIPSLHACFHKTLDSQSILSHSILKCEQNNDTQQQENFLFQNWTKNIP